MLALTHLAQGFAIAHLTLLIFFIVGSAAFPWCDWESDFASASRVMTRVCVTIGLGLSIVGLSLFALGLAGWLTAAGISVTIVLLFAAGCAAWRNSPLRVAFWRTRLRALTRCWSWPLAVVYVGLLAIGSRALIPDATGYSDAIYYHLAYAQDWANAGRLFVDPFLFFPFYANNFVLLFSAWMAFGASTAVHFLTWSIGLVAALAVYAAIDDSDVSNKSTAWRVVIGLLAVAALIVSPIFLDYAVLGYIDVQIGAMALLAVVAIQIAVRDRRPGWLVVSAVIAGFLVGMKASFVLLVPVFAAALVWGGLAIGVKRRLLAGLVLLLCVVSAPWYVRNLALSGDPITPTINFALYGQDGLWKASEWDGLWGDMTTTKRPRAFVSLPVRAYLDPAGPDFREYGASGLILFLFVPPIVALLALLLRRRLPTSLEIPIFVLAIFTLYWFETSSLLRYALLLYPILAVCMATLLLEGIHRWPRLAPGLLLVAIIAALPNFSSPGQIKEFTRNDVLGDFHDVLHYKGEQAYLESNDPGYVDEETAVGWMHDHGNAGRVYVISENAFDYYFRREGITSIGSWDGPAGYFRLLQAIDAGEAAEFLGDLQVRAVLLSPQKLID
ncbi:MAG TPA: hypothetical protein VK760_14590, partial [Candidatus Acidoferrales bacterium]|nr:hypothetical protein [Candidatus Acidoferrales bacterium]